MANRKPRRFAGRQNRTKSLNWDATMENTVINTGAGTSRQVTLFSRPNTEPDATIYRLVGSVIFHTQADVNGLHHLCIYKAAAREGGLIMALEPDSSTDMSLDYVMWTYQGRTSTVASGESNGVVKFDIKVKRILQNEDEIRLAIVCDVAHAGTFNVRALWKTTGT